MKSSINFVLHDLQERNLLAATSVTCVSSRNTTWRDTKGHTVARSHIAVIPANRYAVCSNTFYFVIELLKLLVQLFFWWITCIILKARQNPLRFHKVIQLFSVCLLSVFFKNRPVIEAQTDVWRSHKEGSGPKHAGAQ